MIRPLSLALALCLAAGLAGCDAQGEPQQQGEGAGPTPMAQLPRTVTPTHYSLVLTIDPKAARFRGHDEIAVTVAKPVTAFYLHGRDLRVTNAIVRLANGTTIKAHFRQVDPSGIARLTPAARVPAGKATLVFDYNAPFNAALTGLYKVTVAGVPYAFTQFEAPDARRMFPCFDEPGFKTPFAVVVNAPKNDFVVANTPLKSKNATGGGMNHWVFHETQKLPTYLLALAVGPFDVVNAGEIPPDKYRKEPVRLRGIAVRGQGRLMHYALSLTPKIVTALENYFHIRYPFAKLDMIAVPDFEYGAMENAGAITFRESLLVMSPHAPLSQRRGSLLVQAHEITHQWFGDLVTPAWWDDVWLNESFANWMETKAANAVMPDFDVTRHTLDGALDVMSGDELPSAQRIHNPVKGPDDIATIFDDIAYSKGAAVLAMFEHYVGEVAWQRGIHAYLEKYAHGNATARQFIQAIADATHHPEIVVAFQSYIDQAGIPDLSVALNCTGKASLSVVQSMYAQIGRMVPDRQWQVPMCVSAPGVESKCRMVARTAEMQLGGKCPAYVMPNAQGDGYYRFNYDGEGWKALVAAAPGMDAADQLTLFADLHASLHADHASAADFFAAARAVAPSTQWDLIDTMRQDFHGMRIDLLTERDLPAYRRFVRTLFAPRLKAIGLRAKPHEPPSVTLERTALVTLLVEEARDPETLEMLTQAAETYVASGEKNLGGLSPDLTREALRAAIITKGAVFGRVLMHAYETSNDDYFHHIALYAVAASDDAQFLDSVFATALTPKMHIGDVSYLFYYMASEPPARTPLWNWLIGHYGPLEKRISKDETVNATDILAESCDAVSRAQLENFFRPKVKSVPGLAHNLDVAEERIDRCIAFRDVKGKEVRTALLDAAR